MTSVRSWTRAFHSSLDFGSVQSFPFHGCAMAFCNSGLTVVGVGIFRAAIDRSGSAGAAEIALQP